MGSERKSQLRAVRAAFDPTRTSGRSVWGPLFALFSLTPCRKVLGVLPMAPPQYDLPQLDGSVFLMDGGLETTLTFLEGVELPFFAAFPLLLDRVGRRRLESYFEPFIRTAVERKVGFVLDTPTWRSNTDWGAKLGYSVEQLVDVNRKAVAWAIDLKMQVRIAYDADRRQRGRRTSRRWLPRRCKDDNWRSPYLPQPADRGL